jgi:probable metal-binding protein
MPTQIHGHDVIAMMVASNATYTRDSLRKAIISEFGAATRFHTCSAENMDAAQLIDFLAERGKFTEKAGGLCINPATVCQH